MASGCTSGEECIDASCSNCVAGSGVCVSCDKDRCVDTGISSETECNVGYCSLDPSIVDPNLCNYPDSCSVLCSGAQCTTQAECENAGYCKGVEHFLDNGLTGGCFKPAVHSFSTNGFTWRCDPLTDGTSPRLDTFGCLIQGYSQSQCTAYDDAVWINFPDNEATCNQARTACYDAGWRGFDNKTRSECDLCEFEWRPVTEWVGGVWTPSYPAPMENLKWEIRDIAPLRSIGPSLDYFQFESLVEEAIVKAKSLTFSSEAYCSLGPQIDALSALACDCSGSTNGGCYTTSFGSVTGDKRSKISNTRVCPNSAAVISSQYGEVILRNDSLLPSSFCHNLELYRSSAQLFERETSTLSSEVFRRKAYNSLDVVTNSLGSLVGQIVTDGLSRTLFFPLHLFSLPLIICSSDGRVL